MRFIKMILFFATLTIISGSLAAVGADLQIVTNGAPDAAIVVPDGSDEIANTAALWVQEYVEKASGARLDIVSESNLPKGTIISIGPTQIAKKAKIGTSSLKWDGCRLAVKGNVLYLIGRDENTTSASDVPTGARGTCRAAVTFLEESLGIRWFLPTDYGVIIPKTANITVPANLNKTFNPAFAFVHGRYPYGKNTPASIANNYRTAIKLLTLGGNGNPVWLPAEKYFKDHPEYFAMINGKRTAEGNHLCSSNPEVKKILLAAVRAEFDNGFDWVCLGQEDGYQPCECPVCDKMDNYRKVMGEAPYYTTRDEISWDDFLLRASSAPCERLMSLNRWIVNECRKSHPDKKIHMLLYWPSLIPGKSFSTKCDNVVGEVAFYAEPHALKIIDMWKDKVSSLTVMETWFDLTGSKSLWGVMMPPQEVAGKIRAYNERNVIGLYGIHEAAWGLQGPSFYVQGKMAGDPNLNWRDLVDEYCKGLFGKAGKSMREFYDLLYTRSTSKMTYDASLQWRTSASDRHLILYPLEFLGKLETILERAESEADTDQAKRCIAMTHLEFNYLKLLTTMLISYRAYEANKTPGNLAELKEKVTAFEKFRLGVLTSGEEPWADQSNHDWLCKFLVGDGDDNNYYKSWEKRRKDLDFNNINKI
ncbi:MAG: DUF4838 domain-containing protein, partial [Thermoplasmata archaeon]|nr:DUF4838 domain-containing protein [Thermoplasmata archaeon]